MRSTNSVEEINRMATHADPNKPLDGEVTENTPEQAQAGAVEQDQPEILAQQPEESSADLASELAQAQEKVSQYYDQLLRAKAEVGNIRRGADDEVAKARKAGTEAFGESMSPVGDSFEV